MSKVYLIGSQDDIRDYQIESGFSPKEIVKITNNQIDKYVKKFEDGEFDYGIVMKGRTVYHDDLFILLNKSESTLAYMKQLVSLICYAYKMPDFIMAFTTKNNAKYDYDTSNWRRLVLVGTMDDIKKYHEDYPIKDRTLYFVVDNINVEESVEKDECPNFIRGRALNNSDIILINSTKAVYTHVNKYLEPFAKTKSIGTRLYMVYA